MEYAETDCINAKSKCLHLGRNLRYALDLIPVILSLKCIRKVRTQLLPV